jgi:CheY-like chemotaxis protein
VTEYNLSNLSVLVVEQHATMRSLMRTVLRELGIMGVRDTSDMDTAFEMHASAPADLILTDWSPSLDGMALLHRLRNDEESPDPCVPVIVVTANTELTHVCTARDLAGTRSAFSSGAAVFRRHLASDDRPYQITVTLTESLHRHVLAGQTPSTTVHVDVMGNRTTRDRTDLSGRRRNGR